MPKSKITKYQAPNEQSSCFAVTNRTHITKNKRFGIWDLSFGISFRQEGFSPILVLLAIVVIISLLAFGFLYFVKNRSSSPTQSNLNTQQESTSEAQPAQNSTSSATLTQKSPYLEYRNIINDGTVFFIRDSKIYTLDTASMEVKLYPIDDLKSFSDISFSYDGSYLIANADNFIIIQDLKNKQLTKIEVGSGSIGPNPRVVQNHISPNNKYFIVTTSCCPGDTGLGIFAIAGTLIRQLSGGAAIWSPDGSKLAVSKGEIQLSILNLGPVPYNSSVYLETFTGNSFNEKALIKATRQKSYIPFQWVDNTNLIYKENGFSEPFPSNPTQKEINDPTVQEKWLSVYTNPYIKYWKINTTTGEISEHYLDEQDKNTVNYSPSKKWRVVWEVENSRATYYLANTEGSRRIKLQDATQAVWKP